MDILSHFASGMLLTLVQKGVPIEYSLLTDHRLGSLGPRTDVAVSLRAQDMG